MIWYPSIGNLNYPYEEWQYKRSEYVFYLLNEWVEYYKIFYRGLRNIYKWSPQVVDDIELKRLLEICQETIEDNKIEDE